MKISSKVSYVSFRHLVGYTQREKTFTTLSRSSQLFQILLGIKLNTLLLSRWLDSEPDMSCSYRGRTVLKADKQFGLENVWGGTV